MKLEKCNLTTIVLSTLFNCHFINGNEEFLKWWTTYQPPSDSNWNWRNICKVRDTLAGGYQGDQWITGTKGYTVSSGYHWMQGPHPPVQWYKVVWDKWNVPKHSLIGWLIQHEALNTREKLFQWGLCEAPRCVLCEQGTESHSHLFSDCLYSTQVVAGIEQWLHLSLNGHGHYSKLQRKVCRMVKLACWYALWQERNTCRLQLKLNRPGQLIKELKKFTHSRIMQKIDKHILDCDKIWLFGLDISIV